LKLSHIVEMWDFADPAKSEQRFRDALATASGDWRLELQTQMARTCSLRERYADAHRLPDGIEPQLAGAGLKPRLRYLLERGRTFHSAGDKAAARPSGARSSRTALESIASQQHGRGAETARPL